MSLALGPCDTFPESTWSDAFDTRAGSETSIRSEVGVQTEVRVERDNDRIDEEESDKEYINNSMTIGTGLFELYLALQSISK